MTIDALAYAYLATLPSDDDVSPDDALAHVDPDVDVYALELDLGDGGAE